MYVNIEQAAFSGHSERSWSVRKSPRDFFGIIFANGGKCRVGHMKNDIFIVWVAKSAFSHHSRTPGKCSKISQKIGPEIFFSKSRAALSKLTQGTPSREPPSRFLLDGASRQGGGGGAPPR